jgi:hypothetical protein
MRFVCLAIVLAIVAPAEARMPVRLPKLAFAPLTWDQTVDQAKAALDAAKMAPKDDETRRYMAMTKDQPWVRHTTEPGWRYVPRKGWVGIVHFNGSASTNDYRIDRMIQLAEGLSPGALKDELAAIKNRYGTPAKTTDRTMVWSQSGTTLTVAVSIGDDKLSNIQMILRLDTP